MSATMLRVGALVPQPWMTAAQKQKIVTSVPIKYIVEWLMDRSPLGQKSGKARVQPKSPGDKVLLLKAGTGTGKSVSMGPNLYMHQECSVIITQPRTLTTVEITHDILKVFPDFTLGANIGYQTGTIKRKPSDKKSVRLATIGVLLQQIVAKGIEWIRDTYDFIIIDEVHDRDINVDLALFHIKRMLSAYWDSKCPMIVLMSATFDAPLFAKYLNIPQANYIEVTGLTYPIKAIWQPEPVQDYIAKSLAIVREIHAAAENLDAVQRDILIFVKGGADITDLIDGVKELNVDKDLVAAGGYMYPLGLNREVFQTAGQKYTNIMVSADALRAGMDELIVDGDAAVVVKPSRRVIIATNVAETGVTINTLLHVIDTAYVTDAWYDPVFCTDVINSAAATRFAVDQRRGRVGRKAPGFWYPLFTEETYAQLEMDKPPKLISEDLAMPLLNMIMADATFEEEKNPHMYPPETLFRIYLDSSERYSTVVAADIPFIVRTKTGAGWYRLRMEKDWSPFDFDLMAIPAADGLLSTLERLSILGFINGACQPTTLGFYANRIRKLSPENIRMIFAGYAHEANILDLVTIACFHELGWRTISSAKRKPTLRDKVMVACEFIEYLWIWYDFVAQMEQSLAEPLSYLEEWCVSRGLILKGLLDVSVLRDEQLANLITNDINPFYNGLGLERGTYNLREIVSGDAVLGMREIRKIKACIVDGYRTSILKRDYRNGVYRSIHRAISIKVDSPLLKNNVSDPDNMPRYVVAGNIMLQPAADSDVCKYTATTISILDGFVCLDESLAIS